jgi:metalloendopeptidase OMA1, mitochondrial
MKCLNFLKLVGSSWKKITVGISAFAFGWVLAACYTVPETGRQALSLVSPGEEMRLGVSAFEEIKRKEKISTDSSKTALVKRVGSRIARVADKDVPNAQWEFVLFDNDEPNAFALPGGKVGIHTGILNITQNEAGLAAVMGHEVAHVSARHAGERLSEQLVLSGLATGASIGLANNKRARDIAMVAFGVGAPLAVILPHSRRQESEADRIGTIYMAKAGYNPREAIAFWQRFQAHNANRGGRPPAFLSTHPTDAQRIQNLQVYVEEAEVFYKTSGSRTVAGKR